MLLSLVSVAMVNPRATLLACLATVGIGALAYYAAPYVVSIPSDYLIIACLSCLGGAGGMIIFQKLFA